MLGKRFWNFMLWIGFTGLAVSTPRAAEQSAPEGPFQPSWASLEHYQVPQ